MQRRDGRGAMRAVDVPRALADDADIAPRGTKSAVLHGGPECYESCYMSLLPFGYSMASGPQTALLSGQVLVSPIT
jgi:hypothetical protein